MKSANIEEFHSGYKLTYSQVKQLRSESNFHLLEERSNLTFYSFKLILDKIDANVLLTQYYYHDIATECYLSLPKSYAIHFVTWLNKNYPKCFYREEYEYTLFPKLPQKGWKLTNGNIIAEPEYSYYEFYEFRFKILSPEFEYL